MAELVELYHAVNWTVYTQRPETLDAAIKNSLLVVTAFHDGHLIGLARVVGDGHTILYIQDILVKPHYRRQGIGTTLFKKVMEPYPNVRQKVLLTDDTPDTRAFYQAMGFKACDEGRLVAFARFDS